MPNIVSFSKVAFFCGLLGILGTVEYVIILYVSGAQLIAGDKLAGLHTMSDKVGDANNSIGMWLALEAHSMQADRIQLEDSEENGQREAARMNMKVPSPSRIRCWTLRYVTNEGHRCLLKGNKVRIIHIILGNRNGRGSYKNRHISEVSAGTIYRYYNTSILQYMYIV